MTLAVLAALDRLLEAVAARHKQRVLSALEQQLAAKLRLAFRQQQTAVLQHFTQLAPQLKAAESLREAAQPDWGDLFDAAAAETVDAFAGPLEDYVQMALAAGGQSVIGQLGADTAFDLENPRAVAYVQAHSADLVSQIDDVTRKRVNLLVTQAVDEAWSYDELANALRGMYDGFSGQQWSGHISDRAEGIAVYEMGAGYEASSRMVVDDLTASGIDIEKLWQTADDDRVRPEHAENEDAGWLGIDDNWPSGEGDPPTDSGCRCTILYRRAGSDYE